jgi:hypothetical protein
VRAQPRCGRESDSEEKGEGTKVPLRTSQRRGVTASLGSSTHLLWGCVSMSLSSLPPFPSSFLVCMAPLCVLESLGFRAGRALETPDQVCPLWLRKQRPVENSYSPKVTQLFECPIFLFLLLSVILVLHLCVCICVCVCVCTRVHACVR